MYRDRTLGLTCIGAHRTDIRTYSEDHQERIHLNFHNNHQARLNIYASHRS